MSLITFQEARPWARSIKERVATRQMPPWHIDQSVGVQKFKNDMSLTDEQVDTIVRWVDGGALQGDPKDLPPPKPLVTDNEWKGERDGFGPPDLVVKSSEYTMAAQHQDVWYRPDVRHPDHRAALGEDGGDSSDEPEGPQDHSSLDRVSGAEQRSGSRQYRHGKWPGSPRRRQSRRPRQPPSAIDGVGDRQGLRSVPAGHGQADRAGRKDLVGSAHSRGRRRDHRRLRNRNLVLQEG